MLVAWVRRCLPFLLGVAAIAGTFELQAGTAGNTRILGHNLEVELYLKEHKLKATDHVLARTTDAETFSCFLNKSFRILSVKASNDKLDFKVRDAMPGEGVTAHPDVPRRPQRLEISIPQEFRALPAVTIDVEYEGVLPASPYSLEKEDVGDTTGIIGEDGVYLSPACLWYPDEPDSLATFKVTVTTPVEYEAITEGALVNKGSSGGKSFSTWEEKNVSDGCNLVAGKYKVTTVQHNGIEVYAYFFPEDQGLVESYLDATKRYLDMYQKLLGDYPYKKFAIVENFFQTGYGMPSYTLLGSAVVKLPFIVDTSLGHEILHNWWGNSVFVEESEGNWCEGLTTYMADYHYKELKGEAQAEDYRRDICRKYTSYVTGRNDFPLKHFLGRSDQASRAIGYGKTAMVFHTLRRMVGDELFYRSLRKFYADKIWQSASWKDIQHTFEAVCGKDLTWFFDQWVKREGAPFIELGKTGVEKTDDGWVTRVEIIQGKPPYQFPLPIQIGTDNESSITVVDIKEPVNAVSIKTKSQPLTIAIDPQCEVFRRFYAEEIPPAIDALLGDENKIVVYPTGGEAASQQAYKKLARLLAGNKGLVKADNEIMETEAAQKSLFVLGGLENKLTASFLANVPKNFSLKEGEFTVGNTAYRNTGDALFVAVRHPKGKGKGVALFYGIGASAINNVGAKLPHYGKYGYLVFSAEKKVDSGTPAPADNPLQRSLKN
ncbi:MAG: M1 family aminopeptidase [Planctomycetota bacterium]